MASFNTIHRWEATLFDDINSNDTDDYKLLKTKENKCVGPSGQFSSFPKFRNTTGSIAASP
jgi:hypothetical protein